MTETATPGTEVFERETSEKDLNALQKGEELYRQIKEGGIDLDETLGDLTNEAYSLFESLMPDSEEGVDVSASDGRLHEIRLTLNGLMDEAGKDNNPQTATEVKEMLDMLFGLDEDLEETN